MSGGVAYVLDASHDLYKRMNKDMDTLETVSDKYDIEELKELLTDYYQETGSTKAEEIEGSSKQSLETSRRLFQRTMQIC